MTTLVVLTLLGVGQLSLPPIVVETETRAADVLLDANKAEYLGLGGTAIPVNWGGCHFVRRCPHSATCTLHGGVVTYCALHDRITSWQMLGNTWSRQKYLDMRSRAWVYPATTTIRCSPQVYTSRVYYAAPMVRIYPYSYGGTVRATYGGTCAGGRCFR